MDRYCIREEYEEYPALGCIGCYFIKSWTFYYSVIETKQQLNGAKTMGYTKSELQAATDYINHHTLDMQDDWRDDIETTYSKMISGEYGECRDNTEHDEDGEIIKEATEFQLEIIGGESKTSLPIIFEWKL